MNNILEDELDNLPVPTTAPVAAPAPTTTPATATAKVSSAVSEWDADSEDGGSDVLKSSGLPYVKVASGMPVRLAFVPGSKIVGAAVHFSKASNRYYVCESKAGQESACCKALGDAKGRAAALCFIYKNADPTTGKLALTTAPVVEVGVFTMSRGNWADVKGAVEEGSKIIDADFRISVEDKQLARKIHVIARVARWKEIEAAALALAAPFIADNSQLTRALGRKYEAVSMEATLGDIENL
jgi:hypothetical protein